MKGTITKIQELKWGSGTEFQRVIFRLEGGGWAKTDLCPAFGNFRYWAPHLKVGNCFTGLFLKDKKTVDADRPGVFSHFEAPEEEEATLFDLPKDTFGS